MALNSKYRFSSLETLQALRTSLLLQVKQIESVGQNHGISGRSHGAASLQTLLDSLTDVEAAIAFKQSTPDAGNPGYVRRYANFNNPCGQ